MTLSPENFIAKWSAATLTERSAAQSHFIDLCHVLEVPTPTDADPLGEFYTFEKLTDKDTGHRGFADVWYRDHFAWEYKKQRANLNDALVQIRQYSGALGNPPLLVVCDMLTIRIVPQFTGYVTTPIDIALSDLRDAAVRQRLRNLWENPDALKPTQTREGVTLEAAKQFGAIADRLRTKDLAEPHTVAHFLIRILFCLFSENIGLLPRKYFTDMLKRWRATPEGFMRRTTDFFGKMADGGLDGDQPIRYFNGDLFTRAAEEMVRLHPTDLARLCDATAHDWSSVAPSIFGTLFERGLDPAKRAQIGAHYTSEADILAVVEPVVLAPLRRQWHETRQQLDALVAKGNVTPDTLQKRLSEMQYRIYNTTVLDPACGSGNFLYVTLRLLHDLEFELITWAAQHNLNLMSPIVEPSRLHGIEINPYAAELARAVIWIGHLQWMIEHGYEPGDPVLQKLDNVVCADALLDLSDPAQPQRAPWPAATCIVSNPPFLGSKRVRADLGDGYVDALWRAYDSQVSRESDLVCYFVEHARVQLETGQVQRVGLITTNSIRGGANRESIERIKATVSNDKKADLFMAWADRPWILDGAAVRISMLGFDNGEEPSHTLDGQSVGSINADLTSAVDLTQSRRLAENLGISFQGTIKGGPFDIDNATAQSMLVAKGNPNGKSNSDVIKRWINSLDVTRRSRNMWIIDFENMPFEEASLYEGPFEYVRKVVKDKRMIVRREHYRTHWWIHGEVRPGMRRALAPLKRYIGTPRIAKHRVFIWIDTSVIPDCQIVVFARDDDYTFGVLHSHAHEIWSLRMCTWLGVGNDPRYTPTTTFETFPFPQPTETQREAIAAAARALVAQRDAWLNPPDASEAELRQRTLTNLYNAKPQWLLNAHAALDRAVAAAYGWPADSGDDAILQALLTENLRRSAATPAATPTSSADDAAEDEDELADEDVATGK